MREEIALTAEREAFPNAQQRPRIERISVSQQIHASLRERIVSLELAPGQNLSRSEVAEHYGVSQTPVRDAMLTLKEEGLLVIHPQSKTEVSKIDVEHARETQFLRLSIELEVTRRLASDPRRQDITATARRIFTLQEAALDSGELDHFVQLDQLFHRAFYEAAGVANLWLLVSSRSGHIDRLRNLNLPEPGKPSNILHFHRRILEAVQSGDVAAAEAAVREHLSGTLSFVERIRSRFPEYF